jgi:hypothetical protein
LHLAHGESGQYRFGGQLAEHLARQRSRGWLIRAAGGRRAGAVEKTRMACRADSLKRRFAKPCVCHLLRMRSY